MNRRTISIFLFSVWMFQCTFSLLVYKTERLICKAESLYKKSGKEIQSFTFNSMNEVQWEDENEFIYDGDLYDVISITRSKNKIIIKSRADKNEDQVIASYNKFKETNSGKNKSTFQKKIKTVDFFLTQPIENKKSFIFNHHYIEYTDAIMENNSGSVFLPPEC